MLDLLEDWKAGNLCFKMLNSVETSLAENHFNIEQLWLNTCCTDVFQCAFVIHTTRIF